LCRDNQMALYDDTRREFFIIFIAKFATDLIMFGNKLETI